MPVCQCPNCAARYRVADDALGRRSKCRKCGEVFRLAADGAGEQGAVANSSALGAGAGGAADAFDFENLDALATGQAVDRPRPAVQVEASATAAVVDRQAGAHDEPAEQVRPAGSGWAGYARAMQATLAFPLERSNLITACVVLAILVCGKIFSILAFCVLPFVGLLITGWYLAWQFNVVLEAADGQSELPEMRFSGGWWEDFIEPGLKMLCATAMSRLPAFVVLVAAAMRSESVQVSEVLGLVSVLFGDYEFLFAEGGDSQTKLVCGALIAAGAFIWPMFILVVAVGGVPGLVRVDLMIATIAKTFPVYLVVVGVVYAAEMSQVLVWYAVTEASLGSLREGLNIPLLLSLPLLYKGFEVYVTVVAMRSIGYYYHFFKHRFAWSWG